MPHQALRLPSFLSERFLRSPFHIEKYRVNYSLDGVEISRSPRLICA